MNSLERFLTAIHKKEPDMVPIIEWEVEESVREKIMPGKSMFDFYEKIDLDAITIDEDVTWVRVNSFVKKDQFGVLRYFKDIKNIHWPLPVEPLIKKDQNPDNFLKNYKMPDPDDPRRLKTLNEAVKRFKGNKAIIFTVHSSFLYPSFIRGFENLLMDFIDNPEFAKSLIELVVNYFSKLTKNAIECGADAIVEADDFCSKRGPFMSIQHLREFCFPGLKQILNTAKEKSVPIIKHCDGYIWPLMDIFIDLGIDAINPIEPEAGMEIGIVKKKYKDRIALIGNIDCAQLLTFGNTNEVRSAVKECIKAASYGGGHILSSSNIIHEGVPPENFLAMIKAAREFGKYPINI